MIKHMIIWELNDSFTPAEKVELAGRMKTSLEGLKNVIEGIVDIHVYTELLPSSNGDVMLDSTFVDDDALKAYQVNPYHVEIAKFIGEIRKADCA